jgi:hypothetical protein
MNLRKSSIAIVVTSVVLAAGVFAQANKSDGPRFDIEEFNRKFETAQWLVEYDEVAWKTSDVVMTQDKAELAKLGTDWFCFQDGKKLWHAVYGKFENDKYEAVFHYIFDSAGKITRFTEKIDQGFLNAHAKALATAKAKLMAKIPSDSPNFNQYIRRNSDSTFDVWMFPAFQINGMAVYGGEGVYHLDATGIKVLSDTSYFQKGFRGFRSEPPREIWLNYQELEKPTLGAIFFVWYYRTYFTNIIIDNSKSTSTVVKDGKNEYIWVHVEKDDKKVTKPQ